MKWRFVEDFPTRQHAEAWLIAWNMHGVQFKRDWQQDEHREAAVPQDLVDSVFLAHFHGEEPDEWSNVTDN